MLPPSHVAYTWAALALTQEKLGQFEDADYRLVALAAVAPDLIDKPLAWAYWFAFTRRPELWGWEVGGLLAGAWFVWRYRLYRWQNLRRFILSGRVEPRRLRSDAGDLHSPGFHGIS